MPTASVQGLARIPRRRHRHGHRHRHPRRHPREDRRKNVCVSFSTTGITSIARVKRVGEDPREEVGVVGVGVVECELNRVRFGVV